MKNLKLTVILFALSTIQGVAQTGTDFKYLEYDIQMLQNLYKSRQTNIKEVTKAYLERIQQIDKNLGLNSIICLNPDALKIADSLDKIPTDKRKGLLFGIPVLLKDNIDTHDKMPNTAGSLALANSFPLRDSEVAKRLREAGAIILGKTNLSEWANFRGELSTSGWSGKGGLTKNPYDFTRNTSGSSSGSAAAVAANLCPIAIGTETNGSIVSPSSLNGIVGLKPTVGLVSRRGIIPISYTQDTPGPMTKSVRDAAIVLAAISGKDEADALSHASQGHIIYDYSPFLNLNGLKGKRIGYHKNPSNDQHPKVDALFAETLKFLETEDAMIIQIDEDIISDQTQSNSFQMMLLEYKTGLNDYFKSLGENGAIKSLDELIEFNKNNAEELRYFGQEYLIMANETKGMEDENYPVIRRKVLEGSREKGVDAIMKKYQLDAIIAPSSGPAWKTDLINGDHYLFGNSSPAAIAGYPNITVPMGNIDGLPVGISFYAEAWNEGKLINMAYTFEQKNPKRIIPEFKNAEK